MPTPYHPQVYRATFLLPDGTESDPVIVTQGETESLAAWKARCISEFEAAWNAAHQ
jgi:hypothetical protein